MPAAVAAGDDDGGIGSLEEQLALVATDFQQSVQQWQAAMDAAVGGGGDADFLPDSPPK